MFVRKKRNKSGSVSVQIVDKSGGIYKVVQTLGSSSDVDEVQRLFLHGQHLVHRAPSGQQLLFPVKADSELVVENFVAGLSNTQIRVVGPELVFGALFDRIGFNAIPEELFRHITIARLVYPTSKLKTADYLFRYRGLSMSASGIYRFMDKISDSYKEIVSAIAYRHTKFRLGNISVVFYDMTTLYFESEDEDDLRKIGFSKDGKFQNPQIMLGLLVGEEGLPIGYDIFEGNTFEGHTLLPTLKKIEARYGFEKPIVVADAGLLSGNNVESLARQGYRFIIGGRIKNESEQIKAEILNHVGKLKDGEGFELEKPDGSRLVVIYSCKRARKDAANRDKGVKKLMEQIRSGRLTKQSINNRGYNKFLSIEGKATVALDVEKVKADERWDGLKGYITNTQLTADAVAKNYVQLWQIERAFRISKTDLMVRPIYHQLKRRIESHICIAFAAYAIYKELERLLKQHGVPMSSKRAAELTETMYELEYAPEHGERKKQLLRMDAEQQQLYNIIRQ